MGQTHLSQEPALPSNSLQHDDEIDLKELFLALWQGKVIIIIATLICASVAIAYALLAKQVWTSEARIAPPQISAFSNYSNTVNDLQPVFDVYQEDGTVLVSEALSGFVEPDALFKIFVQEFNLRANKKSYISADPIFKQELAKMKSGSNDENNPSKLYSKWYDKLSSEPEKVSNNEEGEGVYTLQGMQATSESSYRFLEGYVKFAEQKAKATALANLRSVVQGKRSELFQQERMLSDQAKSRLKSEQSRAEYALEIAKAAGVSKPQQNLGSNELFSINIGSNALAAKVKVLASLKQLNIIEPRLQQTSAKLAMLKDIKIDPNMSFKTFQYIESPEQPINRTSPKRALIAILGVLLGGMLGCAIVLVRHAFRKK